MTPCDQHQLLFWFVLPSAVLVLSFYSFAFPFYSFHNFHFVRFLLLLLSSFPAAFLSSPFLPNTHTFLFLHLLIPYRDNLSPVFPFVTRAVCFTLSSSPFLSYLISSVPSRNLPTVPFVPLSPQTPPKALFSHLYMYRFSLSIHFPCVAGLRLFTIFFVRHLSPSTPVLFHVNVNHIQLHTIPDRLCVRFYLLFPESFFLFSPRFLVSV